MKDWEVVYLGIGSNLGNRKKNIQQAIFELKALETVKVLKVSKMITTKPCGGPSQGNFLNGVIKIKTNLSPILLLKILKIIERKLKRIKTVRFGPRTIDLDILIFSDKIVKTKKLIIPHPRMLEREFVLKPLFQIIR